MWSLCGRCADGVSHKWLISTLGRYDHPESGANATVNVGYGQTMQVRLMRDVMG